MYFKGKINFNIIDSRNFDEKISVKIGFQPTKVIKKGEQIKLHGTSPYSIWSYEIDFDDSNFINNLSVFTTYLLKYKNNIIDLTSEYDCVELNLYINTQYGQFGFSLPNSELIKISELGIGINFHFLSFGQVIE